MTISYGKITSVRPSALTEQELWECNVNDARVRLVVCNQTTDTVKFKVALLGASGSASDSDWIRFNTPLYDGDHKTIMIDIDSGQAINIQADTINAISFILSGERKS